MNELKGLRLSLSDLNIVCEAMNQYYERSVRRAQRTREYHSKEQNQQLQTTQKLLQYLASTYFQWKTDAENPPMAVIDPESAVSAAEETL
jgi:DNA-directed RNA polymerase beta' subunit